jgi:membrane protein implicated in regulation of membrane protease activity
MINVSLEDLVFAAFAVVGLALAVATVVFDERLGGLIEALHLDAETRGAPVAAILIGFVSMFGVGGLIAVRLLGVHAGFAVLAGMVGGVIGAVVAVALIGLVRNADSPGPPSIRDLVGRPASVAVAIPAGRFGSVYVKAEGQTHEFSATASVDIAAGTTVTVTGALGNGLVVAPIEAPPARPVLDGDD